MATTRVLFVSAAFVFAVGACEKGKSQPGTPESQPGTAAAPGTATAPATPPHGKKPAPAAQGKILGKGKVLETMTSGGYTYAKVKLDKGELWAAAPATQVAVGDEVTVPMGMLMKEFRSKTLMRVFPEIYFVANFGKKGAPAPGPVAKDQVLVPPHGGAPGGAKPAKVEGVKKLKGGLTVAEVFAKSAKLSGKEIKLRAKVVKYSPKIMGTNWVHLQDGTGKAPANDLTVTTKNEVKVGDTVVLTGKLTLNKDFGSGYKYAVIVEDAALKVE